MSANASARYRVAIVLVGPAILAAAMLAHPHIVDLGDAAAIAAALTADPARWAVAHLGVGVGTGLLLLALVAIRSQLHEAGEDRWSAPALPFLLLGSTLFAMLPALEFAPLVAHEIGADVAAAQTALDRWFVPILLTSALLFGIGAVAMAVAVARSRVLGSALSWVSVAGFVVMAGARFVPKGSALYVSGIATLFAMWPLAYAIWTRPATAAARAGNAAEERAVVASAR